MSYAHDMYHDDGGDWDTYDPGDFCLGSDDDSARAPSTSPHVWIDWRGQAHALSTMSDLHLSRALTTTIVKDGITHPRAQALAAELQRRTQPRRRRGRRA